MYLEVTRAPVVTAQDGYGGTWLIDPFNIEITTPEQNIIDNDGYSLADCSERS